MVNFQTKRKAFAILKKFRNASIDSYSKYLNNDSLLIKFWDGSPNWGDSLNPYLLERVTNRKIINAGTIFNFRNKEVLLGIGSILSGNLCNHVVWGSGFISERSTINKLPDSILAVRGLLSFAKLKEYGLQVPSVYGDPALLFPELYKPKVTKKYSVGLIPHFKENDLEILRQIKERFGPEISIINITEGVEDVAVKVLECECILSSSLHGLILAESYGIPTCRIIMSERVFGGDFKFNDYYSGVGIFNHAKLLLNDLPNNLRSLRGSATEKELVVNLGELKDSLLNYLASRKPFT